MILFYHPSNTYPESQKKKLVIVFFKIPNQHNVSKKKRNMNVNDEKQTINFFSYFYQIKEK